MATVDEFMMMALSCSTSQRTKAARPDSGTKYFLKLIVRSGYGRSL
jgi:hypothetical protein